MSQNILAYFRPIPQLVSCTHTHPFGNCFSVPLFLPFPGPDLLFMLFFLVLTLFLFILLIIFGLVLIKYFMEWKYTFLHVVNRTETKKLKENFVSVSILFSLIVCLGICKFGVIPFTYFSKHFKVMFRGIHVNWHCLLTKTKIFRL